MRGEAVRPIVAMLAVGMAGAAWAATYTGLYFANLQPPLRDGDVLKSCNCQQEKPHTPFGEGIRNLTFRLCNLENCDVPEDARVEDCLVNVHMDSVAILTITVVEYNKRQADVEAARVAAETTVNAQAVKTDTKTVTIAEAIADAEQRKAVAVNVALTTLAAACETKDKVSLANSTAKPNIDSITKQIVSWTYWRRVRVP
jgi:hypothetical protein